MSMLVTSNPCEPRSETTARPAFPLPPVTAMRFMWLILESQRVRPRPGHLALAPVTGTDQAERHGSPRCRGVDIGSPRGVYRF